jgi:hypothetical protein
MELKLRVQTPNGIYSINMDEDDFQSTLQTTDLTDALSYFRKASKIKILRGTSFHDSFVPENPVTYKAIPIKVIDPHFDEFENIEVAFIKDKFFYFIRTLDNSLAYTLMDLKSKLEDEKPNIKFIKCTTPDMRIAFSFHLMEREMERKRKEMTEPVNMIKSILSGLDVNVSEVKKTNFGFEVFWEFDSHKIITALDKEFRVTHAGFCMSGYDHTQSIRSVANVLKDYLDDGSHIYITRTQY